LKINPVNWFDKNDVSHLFITAGIVFFYLGASKVGNEIGKIKSLA
jgi:hypothetical protein